MSDRREFLQQAGAVIAGGLLTPAAAAEAAAQSTAAAKKARLAQLASNSYPIRPLFKRRPGGRENPAADEMKKKYGELTLLDPRGEGGAPAYEDRGGSFEGGRSPAQHDDEIPF